VVLSLFAVRDDGRACGLEPLDRVSNGDFVESSEAGILAACSCDPLDEIERPGDAADRLGGMIDGGAAMLILRRPDRR